jgi:hypothetical protein
MQSEELEPSNDTLEEELFLGKSTTQTVQDIRTTKRAEGKEDITMEIEEDSQMEIEENTSTEDADMTSTEDADSNDPLQQKMQT